MQPADEALLADLLRSEAALRGPAAALERYEGLKRELRKRTGSRTRAGRYSVSSGSCSRSTSRSVVACAMTRLAHVLARDAALPVVHVVELVGVSSAEDVIGEVGSALGVRDSISARSTLTPQQRADVRARIAQQLALAPSLLVLDNCEHVVGAVADLVAFLVSNTADPRVLTTSRAPLAIAAEHVYLLGQLQTADAVALFTERAVAASPGVQLDPTALRSIVTQLDGLPLAIELAAAKVRVMSAAEIDRRLEHRFALLRGGDRSAPDRHRPSWL